LRRIRVPGGFAHAFNGSAQQAAEFIKLGFALGFGGAATFPQARNIRRLLAELPLTAIVVETDAPDIPPAFLGTMGSRVRNSPEYLPRIGTILAELRGMDTQDFAAATSANVCRILRLQPAAVV
jgi:Mg-dependent DNase